MHTESSPLAGQIVKLKETANELGSQEIRIEDWWDKVTGGSWMNANGNPTALKYAIRSGFSTPSLPMNDEVLYGKIEGLGHLVHLTEIEDD